MECDRIVHCFAPLTGTVKSVAVSLHQLAKSVDLTHISRLITAPAASFTIMAMDNSIEVINDLVLELALSSTLPIGSNGRNLLNASAAANSLACRTKEMQLKELRTFEWTIKPLLDILIIDLDNPLASKASLGLRTLMPSRICMSRIIDSDGLKTISRVLDILLAKRVSDMKHECTARSIVENLAVCYREIARYHQWKIVDVGAIRHCVIILRFGDVVLQTIVATTLASLSADLEICKQMFSYGAIKPLLNASDGSKTNEACMLAGLGCVIQLCRIPEIGIRMVGQGAVPLIEKGIMMRVGHGNQAIREKALYVMGYLSKIESVRDKLCTNITLEGVYNEFTTGTMASKQTIMQLLMNVHSCYPGEREFVLRLRDDVLHLLKTGPWNAQNLCIKVITVLYRDDEDRWYMVENGLIEAIIDVIHSKGDDLQEAPLVCLLHLCVHSEIPPLLMNKGGAKIAASLLHANDPVIRELAVILLKALLLYNSFEIERVTPPDKSYLLKRDIYNPQLFGAEYGGLIQEYLQHIVENRRDQDYLIHMFTHEEVVEHSLTREQLEKFQLTFMELDAECRGSLDVDELKLLMVLMGERMDREEIKELLDEYDLDKSGNLDFKEFVIMMKGWNERFGKGLAKIYNESTKRGALGKAKRAWNRWWNTDNLVAAQVAAAKEKHANKREQGRELELKYLAHEQMRLARANETELRLQGLSKSPNYASVKYPEPSPYFAPKKSAKLPPMSQSYNPRSSVMSDLTPLNGRSSMMSDSTFTGRNY